MDLRAVLAEPLVTKLQRIYSPYFAHFSETSNLSAAVQSVLCNAQHKRFLLDIFERISFTTWTFARCVPRNAGNHVG